MFVVTVAAIAFCGCAGAPVQEMSDARQALAAAEQGHAEKTAPTEMSVARRYMDAAQAALDSGDYGTAREDATLASQAAAKALGISQAQNATGRAPP
jgi:hypothetical protein